MNLRRCFAPLQLLFLLAAGLLATGARPALSQETIVLRNGQNLQARILGTTPSGIRMVIGQGEMVQPFANVTAVTMDPPPEFTAGRAAYEKNDLETARNNTAAVVANFKGLPTDWARQAMLLLGDIDVGMNQLQKAAADYQDYQRTYPAAAQSADIAVGLARIDVSKKDYAAAKAKVDPILAQALKLKNPAKTTAALIGRAFLVSGQVKEQSGDLPGALEDYLRTTAIFPEDRVAAASAQERADAIRKQPGITVP